MSSRSSHADRCGHLHSTRIQIIFSVSTISVAFANWKINLCQSMRPRRRLTTSGEFFNTPSVVNIASPAISGLNQLLINGPFRLGETEIIPFDLPHGRTMTTGLIFRRNGRKLLAYFTDCKEVLQKRRKRRGVDTLVVDALRHASHMTHMSLQRPSQCPCVAPRAIYFTHMCHDLGHAETELLLPENIRLAYDGLAFAI